jgi:hypothetical protein
MSDEVTFEQKPDQCAKMSYAISWLKYFSENEWRGWMAHVKLCPTCSMNRKETLEQSEPESEW